MTLGNRINKLRTDAKLSQEQFADLFGVSRQSVQKWESDASVPELEKVIKMAKHFDLSLDALILNSNKRMMEELNAKKVLKPNYENIHLWESYSSNLMIEYRQAIDEGLDISAYEDLFKAVSRLPKNETKEKMSDILFDIVINAKTVEGYPYIEPSDLDEIKNLRTNAPSLPKVDKKSLESKIHGAWMGRICGCFLGKPVEVIKTDEMIPFLKEINNYPLHRYFLSSDMDENIINKYTFPFRGRNCVADKIDGMPIDDDTNYVVLAQKIIEQYGRNFTSYNVSRAWLALQHKDAYCTAERMAFCNFVKGYDPPNSAIHKNPYREWIGAQIRGDYFGYINPGNPELAAEMAFRDASISHVKNGIYGEMFIAAMLAVAACTDNVKEIILGGLSQIPYTSRMYEAINGILTDFENGVSKDECFAAIHERFNECEGHDWCHAICNSMVVVASLLYGEGDFGKSICLSVETCFDTDCNGATVGSIVGMSKGIDAIDSCWTDPIKDTLHTSIFGVGTVKISDRVKITMSHIEQA